MKKDFD